VRASPGAKPLPGSTSGPEHQPPAPLILQELLCASSNSYPESSQSTTIKVRVPSCHCQFCSSLPLPRWVAVAVATTGIPSPPAHNPLLPPPSPVQAELGSGLDSSGAQRFQRTTWRRPGWQLQPRSAGVSVIMGMSLCLGHAGSLGAAVSCGWARTRAFLLHSGSASGLLPLLVNVTSTLYLLGPFV